MTSNEQLFPQSMCSICRNEPTNAVKLDCGHVFCYLCIKSAAETTGACALCRQEINIDFNFKEHEVLGSTNVPSSNNGFYWFYQNRRGDGWWLYDADTNRDLENAYQANLGHVTKLIAGHMYVINLRTMTQQRESGDAEARRIMRSTLDELENVLGLSGLRVAGFDDILDIMKSV